jgi:radical SAM superfamily enzyme YgiQ (UPF0313 family)
MRGKLFELRRRNHMILHCSPPYRFDIPNAALGYLKGFLEDRGIRVTNVYWNVVLYREINTVREQMSRYQPTLLNFDIMYVITTYISKYLLAEKLKDKIKNTKTPFDIFFSSLLTREEISSLLASIKDKVDWYILENDLHKTPVAGFTFRTHQWLIGYYVILRLKELNPDIKIVIGGIADEAQGRTFMKVFCQADFAIYGEGEFPLFYLYRALQDDTPLRDVPQLLYRKGDTVEATSKMNDNPGLDLYPFADHSDYFDALQKFVTSPAPVQIPLWGSRACPWNKCKFCSDSEESPYRVRSPEHVVKEIEYQFTKHNIENFFFVDSDIAGNKKRFQALLELLLQASAQRGEPYNFFGEISPVFLHSETVSTMKLASFNLIQVGFEAVTDSLLEKMQKRQRFAHNIQALKLGSGHQLKIGSLNILRGIPGETEEDILESCNNVKFLRFYLNEYPLVPTHFVLYRGSPFYNEMTHEERAAWDANRFWLEIQNTGIIPESDRFDFFGFYRQRPQSNLWNDFEILLKFYAEQNCSYLWIEYEDSSCIEERGIRTIRYTLDRDETDVLVFCDQVRTFSEVKEQFSHIPEKDLLPILKTLKEAAFLYYDKDMRTIVSVLDASRKKSVHVP